VRQQSARQGGEVKCVIMSEKQ